ncbi:uncharacterized protein [Procambarus clarkii]|uniref:uncharacterized protein isoform X2 n=1 Tax=Procambarus clarkii TaxID=6728 RepID=UPI001E670F7A|nr:uncharacterized protein DDB_G0283357-like isoform X2 [Procambarus clarkii]
MRVVVFLLAATVLLSPSECQRSRLEQIVTNFVGSVGNFGSRISNGMLRTFGGNNSLREAPARQRQHLARQQQSSTASAPLDDDSLSAPNAPQQTHSQHQQSQLQHSHSQQQQPYQQQQEPQQQQQQQKGPRQVVRQNRNRLSFRQMVGGTVSRIMNMIPRFRRRSSNRHRNTRNVQHE